MERLKSNWKRKLDEAITEVADEDESTQYSNPTEPQSSRLESNQPKQKEADFVITGVGN